MSIERRVFALRAQLRDAFPLFLLMRERRLATGS